MFPPFGIFSYLLRIHVHSHRTKKRRFIQNCKGGTEKRKEIIKIEASKNFGLKYIQLETF